MKREILMLKVRTWIAVLAMLALAGAMMADLGGREHAVAQAPASTTAAGPQAPVSYAKTLSTAFREAAHKVLPAVVMIKNVPAAERLSGERLAPDDQSGENPLDRLPPDIRRFFKDFPQMPMPGIPRGEPGGEMGSVGSGVIIDPSGIILTNNHVVAGHGKITVRLHDGREFDAADVKLDPKTDLAIVRIKGAGKLEAAKLGNSDDMQVGDWVLALGDPFGLEGTVTAGIISAKQRGLGIAQRESFIQTDAAINRGNSGGPLVNLDGEVIGINNSIYSPTGGNLGIGFAVPSNLAKWVSDQLIAKGVVRRAYIGVGMPLRSQNLAKKSGAEGQQGAVVAKVFPDTPAAAAGVKPEDVIVEFAGKPVANFQDLQAVVEQAAVGSRQPLVVLRDGKRTTLEVTVLEQPANYGLAQEEQLAPGQGESASNDKLGIEVSNLTEEVAKSLGVKPGEGVVIMAVAAGSPAELAGLTPSMIIVQANRKLIKSVKDFKDALAEKSPEGIQLLVRTAQGTRFIVIRAQ